MVFSGIPFLYYFLPCALALYLISPKRLKNAALLLASVFFYAWGEPKYIILMLFTITQGYIFGLLIEKYRGAKKSKVFLISSVALSLALLCCFKYADFFISNFNVATGISLPLLKLALPVGISFYTFQLISYTIDVYRGEAAQHNYVDLAAYITMFPQLIAGPIVRYSDIAVPLKNRQHSIEMTSDGIRRFILGLGKKVLIANVLGELCAAFKASDDKSVMFFWLYAVSYSLHIYFDFSGYSDMAIGLGKILGFSFMENFNYPFISSSITEFWRRWHMSLGTWFRDYVYIPLGGSRVGSLRLLLNILVVWMLTGFWHGAAWNFVIWGLFFAVLLIIEKLFLLKGLNSCKVIGHIYVMFFVIISFVIFDASSLSGAASYIGAMLGAGGYPLVSYEGFYYLRSYAVVIVTAIIGSTPLVKTAVNRVKSSRIGNLAVNCIEPFFLIFLLLLSTAYIVDGSFNPFLYFRF